jgi:hypothetical protein
MVVTEVKEGEIKANIFEPPLETRNNHLKEVKAENALS